MLKAIAGALQHRGAGESIFYQDELISLGRRPRERTRSSALQKPLTDEQGRYRITFDGAIHNHTRLRRELQSRGHLFKTGKDFEVILHLYEEMGSRCLEKLRGPFAFALWDSEEKTLFLARDRFGIKPLYYTRAGGALLFASEAKALFHYPGVAATVNTAALPHYLTFQYYPGPESALKGIFRLPPAHHLTWKGQKTRIGRYWEIRFRPQQKPLSYFVDKTEELLRQSIRLHCGEAGKTGAFLSSGVDSSLIAALLRRKGPVQTFSVDCEGGSYDELTPARGTARLLGTVHRETAISPHRYWEALPRALWHQDEPVADPAAIALYFAASLAAKEMQAVFSGEGADEIFGGYEIYREPAALVPLHRLPPPLKDCFHQIARRMPEGIKGKNYLHRAATPLDKRYYGNALIFSEAEKIELLNPETYPRGWPPPWEITAPHYRRSSGADAASQMQYLDFHTWLPGDILAKADRMTGARSLEVHLPYLDHLLVEHAATIPPSFKMTRGLTKYILRKAAARHLPAEVHRRPKLGFPVPLAAWIREHYRERLEELWRSEAAQLYFNPHYLKEMLAKHCRGEGDYARRIWTVAIFLLWRQLYMEKGPAL